MKHIETTSPSIPQHDYGRALKSAVSWLGDRYLLAEPLPKRANENKGYFVETRRWLDNRDLKVRSMGAAAGR
jgi:hypothetical protein